MLKGRFTPNKYIFFLPGADKTGFRVANRDISRLVCQLDTLVGVGYDVSRTSAKKKVLFSIFLLLGVYLQATFSVIRGPVDLQMRGIQ